MRLVLDTNVFVSGTSISQSPPDQILEAWENKRFEVAVSTPIVEEIREVLLRPHLRKRNQWKVSQVEEYVQSIVDNAIVVSPTTHVDVVKKDPSDNKFLACALEAKADAVVSGDKHLKELGSFKKIPIWTPREAVGKIRIG